MQTSILIARLMGPLLLVTGLAVLLNADRFQTIAHEFLQGEAPIFVSGMLTLTAGLAVVNTHDVWQGWPIVITLFGWLMVLAGAARMLLPGPLKSLGATMLERATWLAVPGGLMALLGAFLSWHGYF